MRTANRFIRQVEAYQQWRKGDAKYCDTPYMEIEKLIGHLAGNNTPLDDETKITLRAAMRYIRDGEGDCISPELYGQALDKLLEESRKHIAGEAVFIVFLYFRDRDYTEYLFGTQDEEYAHRYIRKYNKLLDKLKRFYGGKPQFRAKAALIRGIDYATIDTIEMR